MLGSPTSPSHIYSNLAFPIFRYAFSMKKNGSNQLDVVSITAHTLGDHRWKTTTKAKIAKLGFLILNFKETKFTTITSLRFYAQILELCRIDIFPPLTSYL